MNEDKRITLWTPADTFIVTAMGKMTYRDWCECERARLAERGDSVQIVARRDGWIALFRQSRPGAVIEPQREAHIREASPQKALFQGKRTKLR